jgi:hypothetical protein
MIAFRNSVCLAVAVSFLFWTGPSLAAPPAAPVKLEPRKKAEPGKFLRIKRDAKGNPVALETATVRYVPSEGDSGAVVDLIGVVHIGEQGYYEALNKQFEQYDALLYELVAPEGTRVPKGSKREKSNPVALLQDLMKTVLDLESQMEHIDYTRKNFVHADLSPEKMAEAIRERGDDAFTLTFSIVADLMRQQNLAEMKRQKGPADRKEGKKIEDELDLLTLLLDPNAPVKLKRLLAEQFEVAGGDPGLGPTLNTILVADRNKAAMQVFQKELARGKKKIGIFYGAAHMPDFEKRLREEFGLKKESEAWLTAWDLRQRRGGGLEQLFKMLDR